MNSPSVPSNIGPALRQFLVWVRTRLAGSGLRRAVTFDDLVSMGLVSREKAEKQAGGKQEA